jgi:hypothetical protein
VVLIIKLRKYYRVFLLSPQRVWQLYHLKSLHLLGHPVADAVSRAAIKEPNDICNVKRQTDGVLSIGKPAIVLLAHES